MAELVQPGADAPMPTKPGEIEAQLAHLFDYCRALLGRDDDAAATARSVMTLAPTLADDPDRVRAELFAIARSRAVLMLPTDSQPRYAALTPRASVGQPSATVLSAFGALSYADREILDLVYRHGIHPWDLSTVLAISAEETYRRLVNAEEEFISLAPGPGASAGAYLDDLADVPLAALPASAGRSRHGIGSVAVDGSAGWRPHARRRVQLAAAAVIPVAAMAWGALYLAAPGHAGGSHGTAAPPGVNASPMLPSPARTPAPAAGPKRSAPPDLPIGLLLPVPGRSPTQGIVLPPPLISPSPSPTSPPPSSPPPTSPPPSSPPPSSPPPSSPPPSSPPPSSPPPTSPPPSS